VVRTRSEQTKLARAARKAGVLFCAYVLALTTILSAWSGNGLAQASANPGVICSEHTAGLGDVPAGGGHSNHQLCAMLCSLLGAGIDSAVVPFALALPWRSLPSAGALAWAPGTEPQSVFLKDRPVRGPPPHAAA
jgi:hypothetical protein